MGEIFFSIPGVDSEAGLKYVSGKTDEYIKMLVTYNQGTQERLTELISAYASGDMEAYRSSSHSLKSGSYFIGANAVGDMAKSMEAAAKADDSQYISDNHDAFMTALSELLAAIYQQLEALGCIDDDSDDNAYKKLLKAIDDFEGELALEIINDLLGQKPENSRLLDIKEKIENFNYFDAADIVAEMID